MRFDVKQFCVFRARDVFEKGFEAGQGLFHLWMREGCAVLNLVRFALQRLYVNFVVVLDIAKWFCRDEDEGRGASFGGEPGQEFEKFWGCFEVAIE